MLVSSPIENPNKQKKSYVDDFNPQFVKKRKSGIVEQDLGRFADIKTPLLEKDIALPKTQDFHFVNSDDLIRYKEHINCNAKSFTYTGRTDRSGEVYEFKQRFYHLAEKWSRDIESVSSITRIISHPCYLKIIAMGARVVPLILESLKREPNHWFAALQALTDEQPVQAGVSFDEAVKSWLNWGEEKGFIE